MSKKVHIEVVKSKRNNNKDVVIQAILDYLTKTAPSSPIANVIVDCANIASLSELVLSFTICDLNTWPIRPEDVIFHVFFMNENGQQELDISENESENVTTSNHWILPNREFHGLWESLIYDDGIKENILKYVETILHFSKQSIDTNLISCNRLVLLHGPPGTGKTSLSKAIAQKIAIRFNDKYNYVHLVEINSHSLFSKWFSESGKLVMKMFAQIREIVEHRQSLVCILIDEIESIAFERNSISSNEPSDSLRVVNAVLTQLDQIRKFHNVLILTTSNLTSAIDFAFLDRVDVKQYIGEPNVAAICKIYRSIVDELVRRLIVAAPEPSQLDVINDTMVKLAEHSLGISGRGLRKIPIIAHAFYTDHFDHSATASIPMLSFLEAMHHAVDKHLMDSGAMTKRPK